MQVQFFRRGKKLMVATWDQSRPSESRVEREATEEDIQRWDKSFAEWDKKSRDENE